MKEIGSTECYVAFADSQIGGRPENQDFCQGVLLDGGEMILTVCDGMGGAAGGSTASRIAAQTIVDRLKEFVIDKERAGTMEDKIRQAIDDANMAVYQCAQNDSSLLGMGTTTVTLLLTNEAAYVAHVGDSRIYQLRRNAKVFRTFDHSYVMENFVKSGLKSEEWARTAPNANIITRALGLKKSMAVDIQRLSYRKGDRFVLCCDGVWNALEEPKLIKLLTSEVETQESLQNLMRNIDKIGAKSGKEYDNFTAIMVDVKCNSQYQLPWFTRFKKQLSKFFKRKPK